MGIKKVAQAWNAVSLVKRIVIGLVIGGVLGVVVPNVEIITLLGTLFVSALKGVAPILVFFLVISALANAKAAGSMKTVVLLYVVSTFIAALVAVVADTKKHAKLSFTSYKLVPHAAILDPALTSSLPPKLTATTGMDALTHAIEAYTSIQKNPVSDAFACKAIELIAQNLPLPPVDYMPVNLEQEIVMVADKYNSKSIPPKFLTAQAYAKRAERYGEANKRRWLDLVDQYGVPDVPALAARFHMRMI